MKILIKEIQYQFMTFARWVREQKLNLLGVNRKFYCQREFEEEIKCTIQCDHCKEYYKSLDNNLKQSYSVNATMPIK